MTGAASSIAVGEPPEIEQARERAQSRLSVGFAEDRIDADELDRRLDALQEADTVAAIDALVADLPANLPAPLVQTSLALADAPPTSIVSVFSESQRRGSGAVSPNTSVISVFGSTILDLRDVALPPTTNIVIKAAFASVEIYVPPGLAVDLQCTAILGSAEHDEPSVAPEPGSPVVHIRGWIAFGSVEVLERLPGERWREARKRRKAARKQLAADRAKALPPSR